MELKSGTMFSRSTMAKYRLCFLAEEATYNIERLKEWL